MCLPARFELLNELHLPMDHDGRHVVFNHLSLPSPYPIFHLLITLFLLLLCFFLEFRALLALTSERAARVVVMQPSPLPSLRWPERSFPFLSSLSSISPYPNCQFATLSFHLLIALFLLITFINKNYTRPGRVAGVAASISTIVEMKGFHPLTTV